MLIKYKRPVVKMKNSSRTQRLTSRCLMILETTVLLREAGQRNSFVQHLSINNAKNIPYLLLKTSTFVRRIRPSHSSLTSRTYSACRTRSQGNVLREYKSASHSESTYTKGSNSKRLKDSTKRH